MNIKPYIVVSDGGSYVIRGPAGIFRGMSGSWDKLIELARYMNMAYEEGVYYAKQVQR